MGTTTLISRTFGAVAFDQVSRETHGGNMDVSVHPVEDGSVISDYATKDQSTLQLECSMSQWSTTDSGLAEGDSTTRIKAMFDHLDELQESKELIDVQTGLKLYKNCLVTHWNVIHTQASQQQQLFSIELVEVQQVEAANIRTPERLVKREKLIKGKAKRTTLSKEDKKAIDKLSSKKDKGLLSGTPSSSSGYGSSQSNSTTSTKEAESTLHKILF